MRTSWKTELPQLAIIAGLFAWSVYLWPIAPKSLPVHFDLSGNVDRMGSKLEGLFAIPTVALVLLARGSGHALAAESLQVLANARLTDPAIAPQSDELPHQATSAKLERRAAASRDDAVS